MENQNKKELHKKIVVNMLFVFLMILGAIFLLPRLFHFFLPLIIAWIIAMIANPIVAFMEKKVKIMRKHGSMIFIILAIVLILAALYGIGALLFNRVSSLVTDLPMMYEEIASKLQVSLRTLHEKYHIIPANVDRLFSKNEGKINEYMMKLFGNVKNVSLSRVGSMASSIMDGFVLTILTIIASYFFITEREKIKNKAKDMIPKSIQKYWKMVWDTSVKAVGGYIQARIKMMGVMFVLLLVPFLIMRLKYAVFIALATSVFDFLPAVGTGTILLPWILYDVVVGEYTNAIILLITYIITFIVRQVLEPKMVGDSIGMSPFATLIFMFVGYRFDGMLGLLIAIPVGMVIVMFYKSGIFDHQIRGLKILITDLNEYRKF